MKTILDKDTEQSEFALPGFEEPDDDYAKVTLKLDSEESRTITSCGQDETAPANFSPSLRSPKDGKSRPILSGGFSNVRSAF